MYRLPSSRKDTLNVLLIFSIVGIFVFQHVFFQNETFFFRDFYRYFFPARLNALNLLKWQGLSAWDPYLDGGLPMLGDLSHYSVLYPGNILFYFLEPTRAFNALAFLHFLLMAWGSYLFFERFSNSTIGAWVFAVAFSLSGIFLSGLDRPSYFYSVAFMPWIAWGWVHLGMANTKAIRFRAYVILAGISLCQFFAGEFQVFLLSHFVGVIFFNLIKSRMRLVEPGNLQAAWLALKEDARDFLWVGLLFIGLSAVQWLPTMELGFASTRGAGMSMERMGRNSLHPLQLLTLLFPFPFPIFPSDPGFKAYQVIFQNEGIGLVLSFHTGVIVALMALLYFIQKGDRVERWILGTTFVYFLFLSLGRFLPTYFSYARHLVPFSSAFVFPCKYFLPCVFLICFFAARFFSTFHMEETKSRYIKATGLLLIVAALFFACIPFAVGYFSKDFSDQALKQIILHGRFQIGISLFFVLCFFGTLFLRRLGRVADNLILLLLAVEMLFYAPFIIWTAPKSIFENPPRFLSKIGVASAEQSLLPPFRIAAVDFDAQKSSAELKGVEALWRRREKFMYALNNNVGVAHHLAYAEKYGPLRLASTYDLWMKQGLARHDIYRLLGTRFFIVPDEADFPLRDQLQKLESHDGFSLFEDSSARPMAWMSYWWEGDSQKSQRSLEEAVPISLLDGIELPKEKPDVLWQPVESIQSIPQGYVIRVQTKMPGMLVVSENEFPGWRAFVDAQVAPIVKAYGTFKSVYVKAGQHEIRMVYTPRWPKIGLIISIVTMIAVGFWLFRVSQSGSQ